MRVLACGFRYILVCRKLKLENPQFEPQLGPFYLEHGEEFFPVGFEEAVERVADSLGVYQVRSNANLPSEVSVNHYDLTKFIQSDWDRLSASEGVAPIERERRGFLLSSRSSSQASGRVAEEIILRKLLEEFKYEALQATEVLWFYEALDSGFVSKARGLGSDDFVVKLSSGGLMLVESKASFAPGSKPERYIKKAAQQLLAAVKANDGVALVALCLLDLARKSVKVAVVPEPEFSNHPLASIQQAFQQIEEGSVSVAQPFRPLIDLVEQGVFGAWIDRDDVEDAESLRRRAWKRTG